MRNLQKNLLFSLFLFTVFAFTTPAYAVTSEAKQELSKTIEAVLMELKKPEIKNEPERTVILKNVEAIIYGLFDFSELSARTIGPDWKNFTPDQKARFTDAFADLLRGTYLEKLDGYNGETVQYMGENVSTARDKVEVFTKINVQNKDVPVSYRMLKKDKWVVYDINIEGVSMVQNYRSQFQGMLLKKDIEGLIVLVNDKAAQAYKLNKSN